MKKSSTAKETIRLYLGFAWHYPYKVIGTAVSLPVVILFYNFVPALIVANVLNRLSMEQFQPGQVWESFGLSLVAYTILSFVGGPIGWRIVDHYMWKLEANVQRDMARFIYNHLLEQSADFHANHFSGSLVSQTNKFLGAYVRIADTTVYNVAPLVLGVIFTSIILAPKAPLFVVFFIAGVAIYIAVSIFVTRKIRRYNIQHAAAESRQTGYLADSITNVMAIKSFAGGSYERSRFTKAVTKTRSHLLQVMRSNQKQMLIFSSLTTTILAISLCMAVIGVVFFQANIATVFLIFSYTSAIANQLFTFSNNVLRNYNRAFGDASDMTKILQITSPIQDPAVPEKPTIRRASIEFRDTTFTYDGAGKALFQNLNLRIKPGEKVGLIGRSGGGKTTITKLLLRFMDIQKGEITIDGQNITAITQDDLRRHIAYVPQEPMLFHRTLLENIRYGNPKAGKAEVAAVAKMAHAHEFIEQLPKGYNTLVGERGVKLSGGQRQRVAIARAMLKNAPILVLDEATSALDSESEVLIQDALWKLMEGRTAIVIAHRLSTIQKMDRIIVLEKGKIVEQGTHKELIRQNGTYAGLWVHQSGGFLEE